MAKHHPDICGGRHWGDVNAGTTTWTRGRWVWYGVGMSSDGYFDTEEVSFVMLLHTLDTAAQICRLIHSYILHHSNSSVLS